MTIWQTIGGAAKVALRALANKGASPDAGPVHDIGTALGAAQAVLAEIRRRNLTVSTAENFANAVQQILVDFGIEPPVVLEASKILEGIAPVLFGLYQAGLVQGGVPAAFPDGGGPGPYRGR